MTTKQKRRIKLDVYDIPLTDGKYAFGRYKHIGVNMEDAWRMHL